MGCVQLVPVDEGNIEHAFQVYQACEDFLSLGPEAKASLDMVCEDVAHSRESHGIFSLVVNEEGDTIGVVDHVPNQCGEDGIHCYISLLMIKAQYRYQGYGKCIIKEIEDTVHRLHGINQYRVSVQTNNEQAIRFWEGQGYVICSDPELQPDTTVVVHMKKGIGHDGFPFAEDRNRSTV